MNARRTAKVLRHLLILRILSTAFAMRKGLSDADRIHLHARRRQKLDTITRDALMRTLQTVPICWFETLLSDRKRS